MVADEEVFLVKFLGNFVLSCIESEQIFLGLVNLAHDNWYPYSKTGTIIFAQEDLTRKNLSNFVCIREKIQHECQGF